MKSTTNKILSVMIILSLLFGIGAEKSDRFGIDVNAAESFMYEHDPKLNSSAMNDITEDRTAVYGFRPNETGSLKQFASYDWTDADSVEEWRQERIEYHKSIASMYLILYQMKSEGKSTEEIARVVSKRRNEIRLEAYSDDPEGLALLKERNIEKFGHEEGPLPDELYEKYGSWERVIDKAFNPNAGMDACLGLYDDYYETYVLLGMIEDNSIYFPEKVDLRDFNGKNYVTPVKFQNPFGTCWAFSLASVAEECYLFDNDLGVPAGEENKQIDLSEKYFAWYMYHHITELEGEQGDDYLASQVGEGCYADDLVKEYMNSLYDLGGYPERTVNIMMAGFGLMNEDDTVDDTAPYIYSGVNKLKNNDRSEDEERASMRREFYYLRNKYSIDELIKDGKIKSADEYEKWFDENWAEGKQLYDKTFKYPCYSPVDDWSIPEGAAYRQTETSFFLKEIKYLDSPAYYSEDGYEFSEIGLLSIKKEIANGHAVGISIYADRSLPDDDDLKEDCIINFDHWAQYYSGSNNTNHAVTIVGYDDNYPKEFFTRTFNGQTVENSTPPENGAFIVKNSWGSGDCDPDDPNYSDWGFEHSGFFYISYYDKSLTSPFTLEFYGKEDTPECARTYAQYDYMFNSELNCSAYTDEFKTSNIFETYEDAILGWISTAVIYPDTTVHYEIYKNPGDTPDSGTLLESGEQRFDTWGYKTIKLDKKYFLEKGDIYSIIIKQTLIDRDEDGNAITLYAYTFPFLINYSSASGLRASAVINSGESFYCINGEWYDFSSIADQVRELTYESVVNDGWGEYLVNGIDDVLVDNYPIKAILISCQHTGLEYVPDLSPEFGKDGNEAYYVCPVCGKWFKDAAGTMEISDHGSVIIPALTENPGDEPTDEPTDEPIVKPVDERTDKPTEQHPDNKTDRSEKEPEINMIVPSENGKTHDKDPDFDTNDDNRQDDNALSQTPEGYATGDGDMSVSVMLSVVLIAFSVSVMTIIFRKNRKHNRKYL